MPDPIPLEPGNIYHIYNRGNNRENLFIEERNYPYFMNLWFKHIDPIAITYAHCLLRNHFHSLGSIREADQIPEKFRESLSQPFSNFFNAYARTINLTYHRSGALFKRPFGRVKIINDAQLMQIIVYIHRNPQKHGFVTDFRQWPYSSYSAYISMQPGQSDQNWILELFGGRTRFIEFHQRNGEDLLMEDDS